MDKAKEKSNVTWILFALGTVICWGLYGAFLHKGAMDFDNDRMKAFLLVGVAYFLVAVIGPAIVIAVNKSGWEFKPDGIKWSLVAGLLGAFGALFVLFALNTNPIKGPAAASQVMSLVFAGAPIVAALYGLIIRHSDKPLVIPWQFIVGLGMAAAGGALVTLYKPT